MGIEKGLGIKAPYLLMREFEIVRYVSFLCGVRPESPMGWWQVSDANSCKQGVPPHIPSPPYFTSTSDKRIHPSDPQNSPSFPVDRATYPVSLRFASQ